ncbi:MAG: insulinase family protein [Treponema sp.]|nr:insulinase family protein [Treponema sp.]MBR6297002.1 insulinase family protein [Treponema sp.]
MIKKILLKNNVVLIMEQMEQCGSVAVGFSFSSAGSRFEDEGFYGASHFCEHMLFKGTASRSRRDISLFFDRIGGTINAFTERDSVCLYSVIPSSEKNLKEALEVMCDMSVSSSFPEEETELERSVIKNEVSLVEDDPEESGADALAEQIWMGSPLAKTITGSVEQVESLDRRALLEWYARRFSDGELTVCVAGKFDESILIRALELLPERNPVVQLRQTSDAKWNPGLFFKKAAMKQVQVSLLYPLEMPLDEKSFYSLTVLNALVGDTMSSRLFESLREKCGLCYSVCSYFTCYDDAGFWGAFATCDQNDVCEVLRLISLEMKKLVSEKINVQELEAAKEHICGEEIMGSDDVEYVMKRLQRCSFMGLPLAGKDDVINSVRSVSMEDVESLAEKIIDDSMRSVFVYGRSLSAGQKKLCRSFL